MKEAQPDAEKLIMLGLQMRKKYDLTIHREPIFLFDKNDGHFVKSALYLTEEEFRSHIIHVPDMMFFIGYTMWIFEIDGWIHNVKDSVHFKDVNRNEHYKTAKLNFEIFNEWEILVGLDIKPNRPATVDEIFGEIQKRMKKILSENLHQQVFDSGSIE